MSETTTPGVSDWKRRHADCIAATELRSCPHCIASRLLGLPETRPFTPRQLQRMSIGLHFQALEWTRLKEEEPSAYPGQMVSLPGYAFPVRGTPDFIVPIGDGYEVIEVKYRTSPPLFPPLEWQYQAGLYSHRYGDCPVRFAVYGLDSREEIRMESPPADLEAVITDLADMLAAVKTGTLDLADIPHDPAACQRSEWACEGCYGFRQTESDLSEYEQRRLRDFLSVDGQYQATKHMEKERKAAQDAAKEIAAAHGGRLVYAGQEWEYRERSQGSPFVDKQETPPDALAAIVYQQVTHRKLVVKPL